MKNQGLVLYSCGVVLLSAVLINMATGFLIFENAIPFERTNRPNYFDIPKILNAANTINVVDIVFLLLAIVLVGFSRQKNPQLSSPSVMFIIIAVVLLLAQIVAML